MYSYIRSIAFMVCSILSGCGAIVPGPYEEQEGGVNDASLASDVLFQDVQETKTPVCKAASKVSCECENGMNGERTCIEMGYRWSPCYIISGSVQTACTGSR